MPQVAKDQFVQEIRESRGQQRGGRGSRGRGGRAVQPQRRAADGEEADMAEAGGIECFNTEISKALFALSDIGCEGMKVPIILEKQQVFFTNADESTDTEQGPD